MDFENGINNTGIILEIISFVLILKATGHLEKRGGGYSSGFEHVRNVMSIIRPRYYYVGIVFVIVGLAIQVVPSFIFPS